MSGIQASGGQRPSPAPGEDSGKPKTGMGTVIQPKPRSSSNQLSLRYNMSRMARRRRALTSDSILRSIGSVTGREDSDSDDSGSLQEGHRLANPGLPGRNSNSSPQTTQVLIGNAMRLWYRKPVVEIESCRSAVSEPVRSQRLELVSMRDKARVGKTSWRGRRGSGPYPCEPCQWPRLPWP